VKQSKLRAIDGTKTTVAPQPRRGLAKLVYQVVKELGGASTEQIKKYLPAVSDDVHDFLDKKKFENCLYSCVYSGYLITDGDKYRLAPLDYYEARQEIVSRPRSTTDNGRGTNKKKRHSNPPPDTVEYIRPMFHWLVLASIAVITGCVGFLAGLLTGLLLHSV
jgi:hypothetical protein